MDPRHSSSERRIVRYNFFVRSGSSTIESVAYYLTLVLPAEVLLGLGISCVMVPAFSIGTLGVDRREAGIAAATVNTFQQIGGSLGVAVLNTIAASATAAYIAVNSNERMRVEAIVHGFSVATQWGAAILLLGAVVAAVLINAGKPSAPQHGGR